MRAILREVAKCRQLLGELLRSLGALDRRVDSIDRHLGGIEAKLAELVDGPVQSSVEIVIGPITEQ